MPIVLIDWIGDPDPVKASRAAEAMMTMKTLDIDALQKVHAGV
ncbi:hypothetical protein ACFU6I_04690 [Streptomyces sp. NPDC057486]